MVLHLACIPSELELTFFSIFLEASNIVTFLTVVEKVVVKSNCSYFLIYGLSFSAFIFHVRSHDLFSQW